MNATELIHKSTLLAARTYARIRYYFFTVQHIVIRNSDTASRIALPQVREMLELKALNKQKKTTGSYDIDTCIMPVPYLTNAADRASASLPNTSPLA